MSIKISLLEVQANTENRPKYFIKKENGNFPEYFHVKTKTWTTREFATEFRWKWLANWHYENIRSWYSHKGRSETSQVIQAFTSDKEYPL